MDNQSLEKAPWRKGYSSCLSRHKESNFAIITIAGLVPYMWTEFLEMNNICQLYLCPNDSSS